ncbi:alpha/beta fold hydrolase [Roseofilum sp. BLCC_M91]|uniref:Alpha/beta fold hydrolase n=1 Tax=Roseofilum halophilum BLCC-M91 TaxID=3022259 RepID=A0ABT7BRC3_9CYAN|nr:alpha/beta fold hydrolase [Roseofilum halophilum]MDJ1181054.1 alpha/beta fold hydrolase [Roseofilum halophilum BLCC-M91]
MSIEEKQIEVGSLEWFYREAQPMQATEKPPVLLLHGLLSQSYSWREVMPSLAEKGFWAIAPDWIGAGKSSLPEKRDFAYTPEAFAQALGDLIDSLELEQVSLVLQGYTSVPGLLYALQNGDRIHRLSLINMPLSASAKLPWKIQQFTLPLAGEMMTQDPLIVDRTLEGGSPYQVDDKDLNVYRRPFLETSAAGRALLATLRNLNLKSSLAEISSTLPQWSKPLQVIWGENDPWLLQSSAKEAISRVSQAEFIALEEVGHYAQEDWPEKVCEALIPFLRRQSD